MLGKTATFLKEARAELNRVTWPSREKATQLTSAVLAVVVVVAFFVAVFDYIFNILVEMLVAR